MSFSDDIHSLPYAAETLIALLRRRAERQPERLAYRYLVEGEGEGGQLTYWELDRQARALGAWLQSMGAFGQRILLLYPSGLEYLSAFFGCLYAGAVAVPAYPPRRNRNLMRLQAIIADAEAMATLTTASVLSSLGRRFGSESGVKAHQWLTTEEIVSGSGSHWAERWTCPPLTSGALAFLQYTSGSTSTPKGVMVSHGNLLHNSGVIQEAYEVSDRSVIVSWLPLYHDMGLIGSALQSVYSGAQCIFMPPPAFLQRPLRWLQAISRYRATISGGPNFAYDLCMQKITREERATLDLSSWSVAFNGSEPVRPDTLERFAEEFRECGFQRDGLFSGYGLAEATLAVTTSGRPSGPIICTIQKSELEANRVVLASRSDDRARTLVSCGKVYGGQELIIVDPESLIECECGQIGEIWLSGPSITQGYWNRSEETAQTFNARLAGRRETPFLRTGDLGFTLNGNLYITGRLKDLIIIRGRNHYPQDIELTVERSAPALRPGCGATFTVEADGEERLVIVQEVERTAFRNLDYGGIVRRINQAIAEEHEISAHQIVLIKPGTISKTSSGKIQRRATMERFLKEELDVVRGAGPTYLMPNRAASHEQASCSDGAFHRQLAEIWTQALGIEGIGADDDFFALGGDSLLAAKLISQVRDTFRVELTVDSLFDHPTIARLSEYLERAGNSRHIAAPPVKPVGRGRGLPLSFAQERLWFIEQLEPGNAAYNIPVALLIKGRLKFEALQATLNEIVRRHEALRTAFASPSVYPVQLIGRPMPVNLPITDLRAVSTADRMPMALQQATEDIRRPFDLSSGLLMRSRLLQLGEEEHVLVITIHHLAADGWSMGVWAQELATLYEAFSSEKPSPMPEPAIQYGDYAVWQREWLQGEALGSLLDYWQHRLAEAPLATKLPLDRGRPSKMSFDGASERFVLPFALTLALKELGRRERATLFMIFLAAFKALLHRYSGQEDIIVGANIANRNPSETEGLIGFFVNLLALRTDLSGDPSFRELLGRVKETTVQAYAHQDLPFGKIIEALQPERGSAQTPLVQVLFVLQNAPMPSLRLGNLEVSLLPIDTGTAEFDLIMIMEESEEGMNCSFKYRTDLFERETIIRMVEKYRRLLTGIVNDPDQHLSAIQLLTEAESGGLSIDDFPEARLSQRDFECLISKLSIPERQ